MKFETGRKKLNKHFAHICKIFFGIGFKAVYNINKLIFFVYKKYKKVEKFIDLIVPQI